VVLLVRPGIFNPVLVAASPLFSMIDSLEFDFTGNGESARDEGIAIVREHNPNFMLDCLDELRSFQHARMGQDFIGEEFRHFCQARGHVPKHHNAWGSLMMNAVRLGLIEGTGEYLKMKDKTSHARKSQLYRFL
jgi:hypothetical protein